MQKVFPLMSHLRQTILPFETASFNLALMPYEKTGHFASTAKKRSNP